MTAWIMLLSLGVESGAWAGPTREQIVDAVRPAHDPGLLSTAAGIPALDKLLQNAGWDPTPELSGVFKPGVIFERTAKGDRLFSDTCILATPRESTYTAAELVSSLQMGVSVGSPFMRGSTEGGIVKKVRFGAPTQVSIPAIELVLSPDCLDITGQMPRVRIENLYVVQEVLRAEISEQTCGRVDARGRFMSMGEAEADFAATCSRSALEPVAVGYRTVPLLDLLGGASPGDDRNVAIIREAVGGDSALPHLGAEGTRGGSPAAVSAPSVGRESAMVSGSQPSPPSIPWPSDMNALDSSIPGDALGPSTPIFADELGGGDNGTSWTLTHEVNIAGVSCVEHLEIDHLSFSCVLGAKYRSETPSIRLRAGAKPSFEYGQRVLSQFLVSDVDPPTRRVVVDGVPCTGTVTLEEGKFFRCTLAEDKSFGQIVIPADSNVLAIGEHLQVVAGRSFELFGTQIPQDSLFLVSRDGSGFHLFEDGEAAE